LATRMSNDTYGKCCHTDSQLVCSVIHVVMIIEYETRSNKCTKRCHSDMQISCTVLHVVSDGTQKCN